MSCSYVDKQVLVNQHSGLLPHLSTTVPAHPFIYLIDDHGNVLKALAEAVKALGFHLLKLLIAVPHHFGADIKS